MTQLWLDHLIFGNGYGMASPHCDREFYWLSGELYWWSGWHGSQLASAQWRAPKFREQRTLRGYVFEPFALERRWGRCRVSWACVSVPQPLDAANAYLHKMRQALREL